jgi:hypothetical protein
MIKEIIPEILHNTKIKSACDNIASSCVYMWTEDIIIFNRSKIIKEKNINDDIREYFGISFSDRDIVLISLLHELAHRFRYLQNDYKKEYNRDLESYNVAFKYKHTPYYYLLIREEREAMKLAKKWFDVYKRKINE